MSKVVDVVSNTNHADGQLARANYGCADTTPATVGGDQWYPPAEGCPRSGCPSRGAPRNAPQSEDFLWDGLALIQRGDEQFINEPHIGGGNPVASSKGTSYFNDALGTTVGAKKDGKYSAAVLSAFGEGTDADKAFFTGKPMVEGLGHAFLMRNYRAGLAKWQTADPMGYPDGWNQLAYCNNGVIDVVDFLGCRVLNVQFNIETVWIESNGGYILTNILKYMKDTWDVGTSILGITNVATLIEAIIKQISGAMDSVVEDRIKKLIGTNQWVDKMLTDITNSASYGAGLTYWHVKPSAYEVNEKLKALGHKYTVKSDNDFSATFLGLSDVDIDTSVPGVAIVKGVTQLWKVEVKIEE